MGAGWPAGAGAGAAPLASERLGQSEGERREEKRREEKRRGGFGSKLCKEYYRRVRNGGLNSSSAKLLL